MSDADPKNTATPAVERSFSCLLRRGRENRAFNQAEAAQRLGVSRAYVTQVENGKLPSLRIARKMLELYGIEMTDQELLNIFYTERAHSSALTSVEQGLVNAFRRGDVSGVLRLVSQHITAQE